MSDSDLPDDERFSARDASNTTALMAAIDDLIRTTGRTLADLEGMLMREIHALAVEAYGERLPDFWRIWSEWNQPGQFQSMGDL